MKPGEKHPKKVRQDKGFRGVESAKWRTRGTRKGRHKGARRGIRERKGTRAPLCGFSRPQGFLPVVSEEPNTEYP